MKIIRIIIGILVALFGFYMFTHDGRGRDMYDKLTKKEKDYLDIIEIWFFVSIFVIVGLLCGSFNE